MSQGKFSVRPYLFLTGLLLLPWCFITFNMVGNADNLWLAEGFLRVFQGERLKDSFFEVNPPLSILIYAVPALLSNVSGISLHDSIFFYTMFVASGAVLALFWLLKQAPDVDDGEKNILLSSFVFASTLMTSGFFGERDLFLALALVPFLLIQVLITLDVPCDRRVMGAIALPTAILLLLKPHFLLLPAVLLLHRIIKRRNLFSILRNVDFLALLTAVTLYAGVLFCLFPDYLFQILPAVIDYYGTLKEYDVIGVMALQYVGAALALIICSYIFIKDKMTRGIMVLLTFMSVLALVPYVVQGLGYAYHLIPATTLLWMAVGLFLYHVILRQNMGQRFALGMAIILCAVGAYAAKPPMAPFISHSAYAELPLVKSAGDCGRAECSVLVFSPSFEISYLIVYYSGAHMASRFPSLFFLPGQLGKDTIAETEKEKYRSMVAADMLRYKPDTVLLASFEIIHGQGDFNFIDYFSQNSDFRSEWKHYDFAGNIAAPYDNYLKGKLTAKDDVLDFAVYKRRDN